MSEAERKRIAAAVNQRASILAYFIANAVAEGDIEFANEEFRNEVESYNNGSGGAGVTLAKLQAVGLIIDLNQEKLNIVGKTEIEKVIQSLESSLPDKSIVQKYKAALKSSQEASLR